jgi:hypothetical protein
MCLNHNEFLLRAPAPVPTSNRYLEDGNFAAALERCHDAQQEESVREAEADSHFDKGQFEHAARLYAQTSRRYVGMLDGNDICRLFCDGIRFPRVSFAHAGQSHVS